MENKFSQHKDEATNKLDSIKRRIEHLTNINSFQRKEMRTLDSEKKQALSSLDGLQDRLKMLNMRLGAQQEITKHVKSSNKVKIRELEMKIQQLTDYIAKREEEQQRKKKAKPLPAQRFDMGVKVKVK